MATRVHTRHRSSRCESPLSLCAATRRSVRSARLSTHLQEVYVCIRITERVCEYNIQCSVQTEPRRPATSWSAIMNTFRTETTDSWSATQLRHSLRTPKQHCFRPKFITYQTSQIARYRGSPEKIAYQLKLPSLDQVDDVHLAVACNRNPPHAVVNVKLDCRRCG